MERVGQSQLCLQVSISLARPRRNVICYAEQPNAKRRPDSADSPPGNCAGGLRRQAADRVSVVTAPLRHNLRRTVLLVDAHTSAAPHTWNSIRYLRMRIRIRRVRRLRLDDQRQENCHCMECVFKQKVFDYRLKVLTSVKYRISQQVVFHIRFLKKRNKITPNNSDKFESIFLMHRTVTENVIN